MTMVFVGTVGCADGHHLSVAQDREGRVGCNDCGTIRGEMCTRCRFQSGQGHRHDYEPDYRRVLTCPRCDGWGWLRYSDA